MNRRSVPRRRDWSTSRPIGSSSVRAASASRRTPLASSSTASDSRSYTHPREAIGGEPHLLGQPGVAEEVAVLAVDRDEEARADQVEHELQLLLGRVAGDVD